MADLKPSRHLYDSVIFDIDGTLWNAAQSTAVAWTDIFKRHQISIAVTKTDIESVAGRPYLECLKIIFKNFDTFADQSRLLEDLALQEKKTMRELGGEFYEGVKEGIEELARNFPLFLVSNCQDWYLESFQNTDNLGRYFKDSTCFGITKQPKADNIRLIMQRNGLVHPIYIGDTSGDRKAAEQAGIDYLHVDYGFERSLDDNGFKSFSELVACLLVSKQNQG